MEKDCVFSVTSEAADKSTSAKFKPTPGFKRFTQTKPIISEIKEAVKNQASAFPPILPTALMSPNFAIPTTNVEALITQVKLILSEGDAVIDDCNYNKRYDMATARDAFARAMEVHKW